MDASEVKTEWSKPVDAPLEELKPGDIKPLLEYRTEVLMDVSHAYKNLIETIMKHPFHVIYRQHAFMNIDQGLHWIKAAVDNLWEIPNNVETEQNQEPAQDGVHA